MICAAHLFVAHSLGYGAPSQDLDCGLMAKMVSAVSFEIAPLDVGAVNPGPKKDTMPSNVKIRGNIFVVS